MRNSLIEDWFIPIDILMIICSSLVICLTSLFVWLIFLDRKQIEYQDSLCVFRAYLTYISPGLITYSFFIQALHRYLSVVYQRHLFFKSKRFMFLIICLTWIFCLFYPFVYLFSNEIIYNADN